MNATELKSQIEEGMERVSGQVDDRFNKLKKRLDEFEKANGRIDGNFSKKSFKDGLNEELKSAKKELSQMKAGAIPEVRISVKAGDMTTGNTYTGDVIEPGRIGGVHFDPDRPSHIRQFMPQSPTNSNLVQYVQETNYDDQTSGQTEGEKKGQSDFDLEAKNAEVKTRATFLKISKQMLDDTPFLTQYINQRTPKKLMLDEDNQILYGDGTGNNVEGISEVAQTYSLVLDSDNVSNRFDILTNAVAQARTQNGEYMADRILVNPIDYWNEALAKGTDGHYIHSASVREGNAPLRVAGVQVTPITAVASDDFFVGDFMLGGTLAMRQGINVRFFEEDEDNVQRNMVTVRVEQRFALPIHNPNSFIYGDFATALPS